MESIGALSKKLSDYLDPKKVKQVNQAYDFACEAHSGQYRSSGDPYVTHPIAVASILGSFRMDEDSLSAAMLHDVMEDSGIPKSVIEKKFNKEVANLVDGVSKLNTLTIASKNESQAENLQTQRSVNYTRFGNNTGRRRWSIKKLYCDEAQRLQRTWNALGRNKPSRNYNPRRNN